MDLNRLVPDAILAAASDSVVATDRDGIIWVWDPGAERIFGHRADGALDQSLDLIVPERLRARHWEGFCQAVAIGESYYGEGDLLSVPVCAGMDSGSRWNSPSCRSGTSRDKCRVLPPS
jgi:PAS domain-containing protein